MKRYVIVGGGAAGLTLAYYLCKAGLPVTVLEREKKVGGLSRSFHYGEWTFDIGPHRFYSQNPKVNRFLKEVHQDQFTEIQRFSQVYFMGRYHDWPLRLATIAKLPPHIAIQAGLDMFLRTGRSRRPSQSFKDYVLCRYGQTLYRTFFKDYTEKFVQDLRALADDITIYNIYGPSEITILSNVQNLNGEKEITIGPPILNTQIYILDKNMKQVPIGVIGEIYIGGIQVGDGYIGKAELTAERFLKNPFGSGKIYKSGDIGRWTFDGKVQCLGRIDNQVKLRGLRIELSEIENEILKINGVTSAIVNKIVLDNQEFLCAYYVADTNIGETTVKDTLRKFLPQYMVPTYVMKLETMPYTINRKIDRKALPLPETHKMVTSSHVNIAILSNTELFITADAICLPTYPDIIISDDNNLKSLNGFINSVHYEKTSFEEFLNNDHIIENAKKSQTKCLNKINSVLNNCTNYLFSNNEISEHKLYSIIDNFYKEDNNYYGIFKN